MEKQNFDKDQWQDDETARVLLKSRLTLHHVKSLYLKQQSQKLRLESERLRSISRELKIDR